MLVSKSVRAAETRKDEKSKNLFEEHIVQSYSEYLTIG